MTTDTDTLAARLRRALDGKPEASRVVLSRSSADALLRAVEGKPVTTLADAAPVVPAEGLEATKAMVDAAFSALPADAHGTIGSGEMERVLKAALRARQPTGNDQIRAAAGALAEVIEQYNHKGPLPDEALMMCWLRAQDVVAALRSAPPVGARVSIPSGLIDALRSQRQIDADGCEVAVSRQACDEAAAILAALLPAGEGE